MVQDDQNKDEETKTFWESRNMSTKFKNDDDDDDKLL
jgi:hypothetical protein